MADRFPFLLISAMYENGGNTTQRLLDGHPELYSYPFESQLGTKYVTDHLWSLYPLKYRWPVFPLHGSPADDYELIIDEECKVRIKTPQASKFRHYPISMADEERKAIFVESLAGKPRTRGGIIEAFFRASALAWKDAKRSGKERVHVGYSPIIGVDADKILEDLPAAHVLNIVRNPWSAYADTKKRPVPLSIAHYTAGWNTHQLHALGFAQRYPGRVHIVRYEDLIEAPEAVLTDILAKMDIGPSTTLAKPSWNGQSLKEVYPWGTIRVPTPAANRAAREELSAAERDEIGQRTQPLRTSFGYAY
jgi:hypothetical protein